MTARDRWNWFGGIIGFLLVIPVWKRIPDTNYEAQCRLFREYVPLGTVWSDISVWVNGKPTRIT